MNKTNKSKKSDDMLDMDEPVEIICKIHGSFHSTPRNHLGGDGCPACEPFPLDKDVLVMCPIHGEYEIARKIFLSSKKKCPKCNN